MLASKLTAKQRREAPRLYQLGYSYRQLAKKYGTNHETIRRLVVAAGVKPRKHGQFEMID